MVKAQVFERFDRPLNFGFINAQDKFFRDVVTGGLPNPPFERKLTNKKYTITFTSGDTTLEYILKGKLNSNKPFDERVVKSVEFARFDNITGELTSKAIYKGLKNLTFADFVDINADSFKRVFSGNDVITGTPENTVLLTGFKGNDKIFIKSGNLARGGGGKDEFILSKDTRNAVILDFNQKKDQIIIEDDLGSNYRLVNNFGQLEVQNLDGARIAFVNSFNDPDLLPATQIVDIL